MGSELYYESSGSPMTGARLEQVKAFLGQAGLTYDQGVTYTMTLSDSQDRIVATGSLEGNVLKCIAVDDMFRGEGLSATVVTNLVTKAMEQGNRHLFLFTKPENQGMFADLSFYPISSTRDVVLMENTRFGIQKFIAGLEGRELTGHIGAVVANCNPFTLGHRYLMESAAAECDWLHLFIVSEDKSMFPADVRFDLARKGVADLKNVLVHPTSDYLISSATFPTYFLKEQSRGEEVNCTLDLTVFCDHFVPALHISTRFVGSEPFCGVTSRYNQWMSRILPRRNVEVLELPRRELDGAPISASEVRRRLLGGDEESAKQLVPECTRAYLESPQGKALVAKWREKQ